jgi:hypothetical protein
MLPPHSLTQPEIGGDEDRGPGCKQALMDRPNQTLRENTQPQFLDDLGEFRLVLFRTGLAHALLSTMQVSCPLTLRIRIKHPARSEPRQAEAVTGNFANGPGHTICVLDHGVIAKQATSSAQQVKLFGPQPVGQNQRISCHSYSFFAPASGSAIDSVAVLPFRPPRWRFAGWGCAASLA